MVLPPGKFNGMITDEQLPLYSDNFMIMMMMMMISYKHSLITMLTN